MKRFNWLFIGFYYWKIVLWPNLAIEKKWDEEKSRCIKNWERWNRQNERVMEFPVACTIALIRMVLNLITQVSKHPVDRFLLPHTHPHTGHKQCHKHLFIQFGLIACAFFGFSIVVLLFVCVCVYPFLGCTDVNHLLLVAFHNRTSECADISFITRIAH